MFNRVREFQSVINLSGANPSLGSPPPPPPSFTPLHPLHLPSLAFTSDQTAHLVSDSRSNRRKSVVSKWAATDVNTVAAEAGSPRKRWCGGGWDGGEGSTRAQKSRVRRSCSVDVASRGWVRPNLTLHRPRLTVLPPADRGGCDSGRRLCCSVSTVVSVRDGSVVVVVNLFPVTEMLL